MAWKVEYTPQAAKELQRLDRQVSRRIIKFLDEQIIPSTDPRAIGEALHGELGDYWKYRIGDYRVICKIHDKAITVIVISVGNRREIYR